jgi:hypothetical protein
MEILMFQKLLIAAVAITLTASPASAATLQLQPIPDAFARLGHSCSGIKQQIFGDGFDVIGNVTGYVCADPLRQFWQGRRLSHDHLLYMGSRDVESQRRCNRRSRQRPES